MRTVEPTPQTRQGLVLNNPKRLCLLPNTCQRHDEMPTGLLRKMAVSGFLPKREDTRSRSVEVRRSPRWIIPGMWQIRSQVKPVIDLLYGTPEAQAAIAPNEGGTLHASSRRAHSGRHRPGLSGDGPHLTKFGVRPNAAVIRPIRRDFDRRGAHFGPVGLDPTKSGGEIDSTCPVAAESDMDSAKVGG